MLDALLNNYLEGCAAIGSKEQIDKLSKTYLANKYCDARDIHDDYWQGQYLCALIVRYWYKVFDLIPKTASLKYEPCDCVSVVVDGILLGLEYSAWRDPEDKLYNDPNGPDKVFNRCIETIRLRRYYLANLDKRKVNYLCDSVDRQIEAYGDGADCLQVQDESNSNSKLLIESYINKNDICTALILESIISQDAFIEKKVRHTREEVEEVIGNETGEEAAKQIRKTQAYYTYSHKFSEGKLVNSLQHLSPQFIEYFSEKYNLKLEPIIQEAEHLASISKTRIHAIIKKTFNNVQGSTAFRSLL